MTKIIEGKFNSAKIYTDIVEPSAVEQVQAMCDNPIFENSRIRIMSALSIIHSLRRIMAYFFGTLSSGG